jgi:hypothetical protein
MPESAQNSTVPEETVKDWDLSDKEPPAPESSPVGVSITPFNPDKNREETRGDLARGLLWLLTFTVGGLLVFVGVGRLEGSVLTQSVFPSLIALAGTALGFYFGSQSTKASDTPDAGPKKG